MTKAEFVKNASRAGYCTQSEAAHYCSVHKKEEYTEDDYSEVCRYSNAQYYKQHDRTFRTFGIDGVRSSRHFYEDGGSEGNR